MAKPIDMPEDMRVLYRMLLKRHWDVVRTHIKSEGLYLLLENPRDIGSPLWLFIPRPERENE
jgi:hypothetical protein